MKTKILYVEDEPFLGKLVLDILEGQGFEVLLKTTGASILDCFRDFMPNLCILDIMLPDADGLELGQAIRQKFPPMPIIYLTAKSQTADVLKGFEAGGNDYIKKPFSIEELIARINNQLKLAKSFQPGSPPQMQEIKLGLLTFYPEKFELHTQRKIIKLSYREGQVLSLLTSSLNKIVDRKSLLISVWGDDSYYNSRTLDVYIRRLREYFQEEEGIEIHTLKGRGYSFITPG